MKPYKTTAFRNFLLMAVFFLNTSCNKRPAENQSSPTAELIQPSALPSWDSIPGERILNWVKQVTDSASADFIPVEDRIAVFDNDGTLWPEQPVPNQLIFAIDLLKTRAPEHPEWQKDKLLNSVLNNDLSLLKSSGVSGLIKLVNASHGNISESDFNRSARNWIDTARDSRFNYLYKEMAYVPMIELLEHLRRNGFTTFIVSGGGADFMRVWSMEAYGIPSYQVIGSYGDLKFQLTNGRAEIIKTDGNIYVDDKAGKPVAIHRFIGKIPVFCGGNSDGDQAMMEYTSSNKYKTMCMLLHHTDSIREYAYDINTLSGHLETALEEAKTSGWLVVDMEKDFKKIFKPEK
ncbi:MAG TPA: HAD family hydrolase [Bacteroidia bacterium]|nr:HAD family hydrolase [Bacteroidia bacterium]